MCTCMGGGREEKKEGLEGERDGERERDFSGADGSIISEEKEKTVGTKVPSTPILDGTMVSSRQAAFWEFRRQRTGLWYRAPCYITGRSTKSWLGLGEWEKPQS